MDLVRLIELLSEPAAYPDPVAEVEIHQTHISVVFLAGQFAYKIKKPVDLGFLDFSTLERRRHFCEEEVRLNRRLAPQIYLGVVPIIADAAGAKVEAGGEPIEWAVKMRRLPADASFESRLDRGDVEIDLVKTLARKIAAFHSHADRIEQLSPQDEFESVSRNVRENFQQVEAHIDATVNRNVFRRVQTRAEQMLAELRPLIESRAQRGMIRDTHGDLRLDHVYLLPDAAPWNTIAGSPLRKLADRLVVIDCIEFNKRFRFADPVADTAFLVMDLVFHARRDLANTFAAEYFRSSGDNDGKCLSPFYVAYRATVRAKVASLLALEAEISEADRAAAKATTSAYWLLALGQLEPPNRRPCLILVGGLPGTGKSTLSRGLAESAGLELIRSDVVRKKLAGASPGAASAAEFGAGIYTPEWNDRTYAECARRVEEILRDGGRVILDASFVEENRRRAFLDLAARLTVPAVIFVCQSDPSVVRQRLAARRSDVSDADWAVHQIAADRWEPAGPKTQRTIHILKTDGPLQAVLSQAHRILIDECLLD